MIASVRIAALLALLMLPALGAAAGTDEAATLGSEFLYDNIAGDGSADANTNADAPAAGREAASEAAEYHSYRMLQQRNATTFAWILAVTAVVAHLATLMFLHHMRAGGTY